MNKLLLPTDWFGKLMNLLDGLTDGETVLVIGQLMDIPVPLSYGRHDAAD